MLGHAKPSAWKYLNSSTNSLFTSLSIPPKTLLVPVQLEHAERVRGRAYLLWQFGYAQPLRKTWTKLVRNSLILSRIQTDKPENLKAFFGKGNSYQLTLEN